MGNMLKLIWWAIIGLFRSRTSLEAEILTLRHQLNVLKRKSLKRLAFSNFDRLVFSGLYWIAPLVVNALVIVKPETVIRWHRAGFRMFWGLVTSERPHLARPAPVMTTFMPFMNTLSCYPRGWPIRRYPRDSGHHHLPA